MSDDIVTRLREEWSKCQTCMAGNDAADEFERLRKMLDDVLERENKDNARQLDIVRKVEANRDMWRNTCTKLVGMMLPFSLLMKPNEQEELTIILREATFDSPK